MNTDQKYSIILADPPWRFEAWSKNVGKNGRSPDKHYQTMTTEEICQMTIPAADNAVLFLWSCWPTLPDAMQVITAWKFEYKTVAWVWIKSNPTGFGHHMGMGYYTRANSEPCLLATRGDLPKPANRGILSLIYAPVLQHSRKPDDQYRKIEALYPTSLYPNRLELFARRRWPGYAVWGNQAPGGSDIVLAEAA